MLDTLEVHTRVEQDGVNQEDEVDADEKDKSSSSTDSKMAGFEVILHQPSQSMKEAAYYYLVVLPRRCR